MPFLPSKRCAVTILLTIVPHLPTTSGLPDDGNGATAAGHLRGTSATGSPTTAHSVEIKNSALQSVVFASSCNEKKTVPPGEKINLSIAKSQIFWVVPESMNWVCNTSCSDCFYLNANLTEEGVLKASVGYGVDFEIISNATNATDVTFVDNATEIQPGVLDNNTVVSGVELMPVGRFDGAKDAASCTRYSCDLNLFVSPGRRGLRFEIHGKAILEDLESSWWGGGHGGWHGGYYHHHY